MSGDVVVGPWERDGQRVDQEGNKALHVGYVVLSDAGVPIPTGGRGGAGYSGSKSAKLYRRKGTAQQVANGHSNGATVHEAYVFIDPEV